MNHTIKLCHCIAHVLQRFASAWMRATFERRQEGGGAGKITLGLGIISVNFAPSLDSRPYLFGCHY